MSNNSNNSINSINNLINFLKKYYSISSIYKAIELAIIRPPGNHVFETNAFSHYKNLGKIRDVLYWARMLDEIAKKKISKYVPSSPKIGRMRLTKRRADHIINAVIGNPSAGSNLTKAKNIGVSPRITNLPTVNSPGMSNTTKSNRARLPTNLRGNFVPGYGKISNTFFMYDRNGTEKKKVQFESGRIMNINSIPINNRMGSKNLPPLRSVMNM